MSNTDYTKYPWDKLGERREAALQHQYQQSAHAFSEHLHECKECTSNGLCPTGTQYNKICRNLEDEQEMSEGWP